MAGAAITLSGAINEKANVDANGNYRFRDVPPGEYTLEIHSGPNIVWGATRKVNVAPKGCAKVDFQELPHNPEIAQRSLLPDDLCPNQPH